MTAPTTTSVDVSLDAAVRTFRTAAAGWLGVVTALSYGSVERPWAAAAGVGAAWAVTAVWWLPQRHRSPRSAVVAAELTVGAALVAGDGWVLDDGRAQSFGGVWPLAGVLVVAARSGGRAGATAGVGLGVARAVGEVVFVGGGWTATRLLAVASTGVLFALAGWAAGWAGDRIRRAEREASRAEARQEVAGELHDGVLQTLAVIQRRGEDPDLVRLARTQEAQLRHYLAEATSPGYGRVPLGLLLREVAADAAARLDLRAEIAAVPPLPALDGERADDLRGAVSECLANVAKHAGVDRAVIFAEADGDTLTVAVTDDGRGFDQLAVIRRGLDTSVGRRMARLGGRVEIRSAEGAGTSIALHVPTRGVAR